jgi:hypothetical protein
MIYIFYTPFFIYFLKTLSAASLTRFRAGYGHHLHPDMFPFRYGTDESRKKRLTQAEKKA